MFNECCDTTYVLKRLAVLSVLLHWPCTSEFVLKQHVLLSVCFHDCSVWEQHRPWWAVIVHVVSAISPDTPSSLCISTRRNQGVSSLEEGVARNVDLHDQSNVLLSTDSSTEWLAGRNEVECHRVPATYFFAFPPITTMWRLRFQLCNTFFTQNRTMNNQPMFLRRFMDTL
jgi:hypothetical protein